MRNAIRLFRCVRVSQLVAPDLADSGLTGDRAEKCANPVTSAEELKKKAEPAILGDVDAFFSHSWRDEVEQPGEKFHALMDWAKTRERATNVDPTIWLDKACVDQNNVDQSLACLPVFLASCKLLLVVAGDTYTSRLWCVMECFVYLQMRPGLTRDDMLVIPIGKRGDSVDAVVASFSSFRGENAQCFKKEDREKMLAIIEASFGDFTLFDESVRKALVKGVKTFSFHENKMGRDSRATRVRGTSILDEDLSDVVSEESSSLSQRFAALRPPGIRKKSTPRGEFSAPSTPRVATRVVSTKKSLEQQHAAGGCRVEYEAEDERV